MDWYIWCGDITCLKVDAIVNAANTTLQGGAGVDGAIHQVAGIELLHYCQKNFPTGCHTGEARITPGFALPSAYVIHTPGPVWKDDKNNEAGLLAACYHSVMVLADISDYAPSIILVAFDMHTAYAYEVALRAQQIPYSKEINDSWLNGH